MTDRLDVLAKREIAKKALQEGVVIGRHSRASMCDHDIEVYLDREFPLSPEPQSITGPSGIKYRINLGNTAAPHLLAWLESDRLQDGHLHEMDLAHVGALLSPGGVPGVVRAALNEVGLLYTGNGISPQYVAGDAKLWPGLTREITERLDSILSRLSQKAGEP